MLIGFHEETASKIGSHIGTHTWSSFAPSQMRCLASVNTFLNEMSFSF